MAGRTVSTPTAKPGAVVAPTGYGLAAGGAGTQTAAPGGGGSGGAPGAGPSPGWVMPPEGYNVGGGAGPQQVRGALPGPVGPGTSGGGLAAPGSAAGDAQRNFASAFANPAALAAFKAWIGGQGGNGDGTPPPNPDPYGTASSIADINKITAAQEATINGAYDTQLGNLHSSYGNASAGVTQEGQHLQNALAGLSSDARQQNAASAADIHAGYGLAIGNTNAMARGYAKDVANNGGDTGGQFRGALAATLASDRANGVAADTFSARLGALTNMALNNRMATGQEVTAAGQNELKVALQQGLSSVALEKAKSDGAITVEGMREIASVHAAAQKAYLKAATGKPLTPSALATATRLAMPPNYAPAFSGLLKSKDDNTITAANAALNKISGPNGLTPDVAVQQYKKFLASPAGQNLPYDGNLVLSALESATRQYEAQQMANQTVNLAIKQHTFG